MTRAGPIAAEEVSWRAGPVEPCSGDDAESHGVWSVHVVVRCECGAAFMSTDATIALGMAQRHEAIEREGGIGVGDPALPPSPVKSDESRTASENADSRVGPHSIATKEQP